jgi:ADP-glucose pyrophosphorylase
MGVCGAVLSLLEGTTQKTIDEEIMVSCGEPDLVLFMNHDICCSFPLTDMINDHMNDANKGVLTVLGLPRNKNENLKKFCYFVEDEKRILKHCFPENQETHPIPN